MKISDYPVSEKNLGANYTQARTIFNVWAPTQKDVKVALYDSAKAPFRTLHPMLKGSDGVFSTTIEGDLHGLFYTYIVDGQTEVTDPYSLSTSANSARSAVVDLEKTHPENWQNHHRPNGIKGCDAILYEVHVGDFSAHKTSGMTHKGKFLAFTENGTSYTSVSTGIDHLVELGVTHVHLMPVYDFLTVDEELVEDKNYNWGYDPEHYNAPEGSYASDPNDPVCRIRELKAAIMALHEKGLKVVLDVVYNHTFRTEHSNFNVLVPKYYHRTTETGEFSNGSGCGNEFASETPMGRRFIVDSLVYWAKEYKVDGFRFDLMALIDLETITIAKKALRAIDPEIMIYGEPWMGGLSTLPDKMRVYKGSQCDQQFSLFNDDFRDAIKGDNDGSGKGFIHGNRDMKHQMHVGLAGSIPYDEKTIGFTTHPCESINYFNSHDNLILEDKLRLTTPEASYDELLKQSKLAFNLLFMAQGVPFFHAGNEFLRNKKGHHNTYNAPFSINAIDWSNKVKHEAFFKYVKDVIKLRKTYKCFRMNEPEMIKERIHFIEDDEFKEAFKDGIVMVIKQNEVPGFDGLLIAHNPGHEPMLLSIDQLKEAIIELYTTKKMELPNDKLLVELIFDERGLLDSPERIDATTHHLVRVDPVSSSVYKIGRLNGLSKK